MDEWKVQAILHRSRSYTPRFEEGGVPEVFGMNFQAVSVGQKLAMTTRPADATSDHGFRRSTDKRADIWTAAGRGRRC